MRKLILAPMALACLIGTAAAQQAPTMNVGNFPATQAVTQSGSWGFGLTGPIPAGSNVIGGVTQSGTWSVGLAAGSNAIGSVLADLRVAGAAVTSGNPVPVSVDNFPATQTVAGTVTANLGTLNGAALDSSVQAVRTTMGSPFQAGGSIGNTAFGISGLLPAFAATPTFNLGTLNGAATSSNQASEIAALQALNTRAVQFTEQSAQSVAASTNLSGTVRAAGSPVQWAKFSGVAYSTQAGTLQIRACPDSGCSTFFIVASAAVPAGGTGTATATIVLPYHQTVLVNGSGGTATAWLYDSYTAN